eukprot:CAMPEP_0202861954 /NCGR_PEP_ID=MMETSP1391-20130828/3170_1 /ASSEMBLY_ACC=CAM_ASM_000867 /TAXON_ID=1034604 /ORGANISM="Chlamydomonas leiostraca, Strain SAG 11-49" /LENGTH=120 /DNA_ID=CAMNT_0049541417 /DNA_START=31 /DNA_END=390 /DNA_ORIENTATION=+
MALDAPAGPPPPDVVTERQRQGWNWAAQKYAEMLETTAYIKPATDLIINTLRDKYGSSAFTLLDVAASVGEPGISIAQCFPQCRVVSTDLAEENAKIGPAFASKRGVANITYESADGQAL